VSTAALNDETSLPYAADSWEDGAGVASARGVHVPVAQHDTGDRPSRQQNMSRKEIMALKEAKLEAKR
jgi:hypothetical protein